MTSGDIGGALPAAGAAGARSGGSTGLVLACAVSALALPSAVLAFTASFARLAPSTPERRELDSLEGGVPGLRLARGMPLQSFARAPVYPFTPASNPNRPDRSVTVAVRIDPQAMRAIGARGAPAPDADGGVRLAQSGFNLGVARGYRNFAQAIVPASAARRNDPPDIGRLAAAAPRGAEVPRFSSRVVVDDRQPADRAPRSVAGDRDDQVDVSGSYRLTRNLDVTAGVRYSQQDRERLLPLTDGRQDSQAVYVGTQIHF